MQEYREQNLEPDLLWEVLKSDIRGETVKFASNKKRKNEKKVKEIEAELNLLEQLRDESNNQSNIDRMESLNIELQEIYNTRTIGIMTRAKVRWLKDGEKNSKYFIGLKKRNFLSKSITRLINNEGDTITNFKEILEEQKQFYADLYTETDVELDDETINKKNFPTNINLPKLTDELKNICEGLISKEECVDVLQTMDNYKSPGIDWLPVEFYKFLGGTKFLTF